MKIILSDAGKRFNREWIFRHFDYQFFSSRAYAITGPNGSGKSTLLQFIAGALMPSEGKIAYYNLKNKPETEFFRFLSIAAPYIETIEELTASEFFKFHNQFKPLMSGMAVSQILERVGLKDAADKQIRYYSSGMKQRLKLAQAFFSDTPILLLDEPTTNLDGPGIAMYHELIQDFAGERLLIISSNDPMEYSFCQTVLDMKGLKSMGV
ncbi:MAG TPA: ATP-binding cassette domain-containing protein [Chryseolinea sp.]|nr:ATP-binding cassette domain-containing protein [Chryseolinea sp.]